MKRAFLLMVVPALLVGMAFAQTPTASSNTDATKIKGCLGGSDGNYTVVEDNTGHTYKITTSSLDLKAHVGHDVTLIGYKASGASASAADNSVAVTELNMISEHCAAATSPVGSISESAETTITPAASPAAPAATISTPPETAVTPAASPAAPAATTSTLPESAVTPAASPTAPAATISTPAVSAVTPTAATTHAARLPAHTPKPSTTPAAATPAAPASASKEPVSTPDAAATTPAATASTSSDAESTPAPVATTPTAPAKGKSLWLLIAFAVLVIALGVLAPWLSRWRKRRMLERTGAQNLSLNAEASSDQNKSDQPTLRKVA